MLGTATFPQEKVQELAKIFVILPKKEKETFPMGVLISFFFFQKKTSQWN